MDNEEMNDPLQDLLASSLEGNALSVQDAVNAVLSQKALDALSAMKVDVAQSIYGTYGSEEQETEMELDGPEEPEGEASDEDADWEIPEDDDFGLDDAELEDMFGELEDLTSDDSEQSDSEEDSSDE